MSHNRKLALIWAAGVAALIALVLLLDKRNAPSAPFEAFGESTAEVVQAVHTPEQLDIVLDASGRPYDTDGATYWADRVERSFLTTFTAPDGKVSVMDGSAIIVDPFAFRDEGVDVVLPSEDLDVFVHREFFEGENGDWDQFLALEVVTPGSTVVAWDDVEFGYGTDGGQGGIISNTLIEAAAGHNSDDYFIETTFEDEIEIHDLDGSPGNDAIVFSNGWGDGGFPMVRGRDANGDVVAFVVFDFRYPWRLMFPDVPPPADITVRENELAECLAGERDVEVWSQSDGDENRFCVPDDYGW